MPFLGDYGTSGNYIKPSQLNCNKVYSCVFLFELMINYARRMMALGSMSMIYGFFWRARGIVFSLATVLGVVC